MGNGPGKSLRIDHSSWDSGLLCSNCSSSINDQLLWLGPLSVHLQQSNNECYRDAKERQKGSVNRAVPSGLLGSIYLFSLQGSLDFMQCVASESAALEREGR